MILDHSQTAGVLLYHILAGGPQFPFFSTASPLSPAEAYRHIAQGNIDFSAPIWGEVSPGARTLVERMLQREPERCAVLGCRAAGCCYVLGEWKACSQGSRREECRASTQQHRTHLIPPPPSYRPCSRITACEALESAWLREHTCG